ncbi:hypothetical protein Y032_0063g3424 [Ancylostoma ceylanicum]|uniref:Uncharacterized protein n=1 Tax=Ancylostoma ceylanicum TaxID=53326 RepID=A0A016U202_9BILA|nr:hypothetical protein Y032_0063g3424 [Ancylostoma ceylanicum]
MLDSTFSLTHYLCKIGHKSSSTVPSRNHHLERPSHCFFVVGVSRTRTPLLDLAVAGGTALPRPAANGCRRGAAMRAATAVIAAFPP